MNLLACIGFLIVCCGSPPGDTKPEEPQVNTKRLDELVDLYFAVPRKTERAKIGVQIAELVDGRVGPVAEALDRVQLWSPQPAGLTDIEIKTGKTNTTVVSVYVPQDYDEKKRYPLLLALHGMNGRGQDILGYLRHYLGDTLDEFIIAAPTDYRGTWFNIDPDEADDPPLLLTELRRRYHVDTNRVYVMGYSAGGHGAWMLAALYTDEFAAAIPVAGTLWLPVDQAYPLLLPNLTDLPVLAVWGERDIGDDKNDVTAGGGIAGFNQRISRMAARMNLPINAIELPGVGHSGVEPPIDLVKTFLNMRRDPAVRTVQHWFRFPAQGRIGWLRQRKFIGRPWAGNQISIMVDPGTSVDEYVTEFLEKKLAYLGGSIEGQRIEIKTKRSAEIEILLNDDLVDLNEQITVVAGDKRRFEGKVEPKVKTLLDVAYEDWDFQRLYPVRLVMRPLSKAWQE